MSNVLKHYEYLHTIPELGLQEFKTSAYLADKLEAADYQVTRNIGGATGVTGLYDSGVPGPTLALRADMDALGHIIDGIHCARHTCGHDGHSSVVLSAAEDLIKNKAIKKGRLKILFQPAEEIGAGAITMVEGGSIDDVDMLLGSHIRPLEECPKGKAIAAMYYSASATADVFIHGKPAHGARPHLGINVIDAAAAAIMAVNAIHLNPNWSYSAKATRFLCDAGVTNAIPAEAHLAWDVRAQHNEVMAELQEKVAAAIKTGAATVGATAEVDFIKELPAAEIDGEMTDILAASIIGVLGAEGLIPSFTTAGGEDFFFYKKLRPDVKVGFFGLGVNATPGLHHPDMHFDLDALENGVEIFKTATLKILG